MNNFPLLLKLFYLPLIAALLSACGSEPEGSAGKPEAAKHKNNHVDSGEASDSVKQKFANAFAKKCVTRELKNSINKDVDQKRFEESCGCIAKHMAENLSDVDAEKYLQEHEDTQTLEIKFDTAAYFCLQNKPQPKGPNLFGRN